LDYKEGDIRVTIENIEEMKIKAIERYIDGQFSIYDEFNTLYENRNREDGKFSIRELNNYALQDNAPNKRKFLLNLIEELEKNGFMKVSNPISLYDNLLVGRKRSGTAVTTDAKDGTGDESIIDDELEDIEKYEDIASLLNFNPNLILYGPPGTGKTYATKKIIHAYEKKYHRNDSGYELANLENRVRSITFHQSYSYEEFIEGIRPILSEDAEDIGYRLENGVFKEHSINALANEMTEGDIVMIYDGPRTMRMVGIINGDYRYEKSYESYKHRRSVKWLKDLKYPIDIYKYNGNTKLTQKTIYPLVRMEISDVMKIVSENTINKQEIKEKAIVKPYYMIIDEINRGNISKIFGELITLIEQDKREVAKAYLPYSKKEFTVPNNLYIIGTMNTADRSIATIDTALRRRFTFVEIEPDSNIIVEYCNPIVNDNVDLVKLMDDLNQKILEHYDRDHRIGHSYFMGIESLRDLYQVWYYEILPLLNEYFYNDIDTLTSIVSNGFHDKYGNVKYLSLTR